MRCIVFFEPVAVIAAHDVIDPFGVIQVPLHRFADTGFECLGRLPAQFALELARVDRVASIVARTVFDERDLGGVRLTIGARLEFIQNGADRVHDFQVGLFIPAAHVVGFAELAAFEHAANRRAVVGHVQPVAHLLPIAIDRQRLARAGIGNHQRNQLLGEVIRTVVIAAIGGQHRQAIRVVPGANEVIGRGLAGAVRAVGLVRVLFGKRRIFGAQRAIDFVGGNMQKTEVAARGFFKRAPIGTHRFEQVEGAHDVRLDEIAGAMDGAIHMGLGGEIQHGTRLFFSQQRIDRCAIADIGLHEAVIRIAGDRFERLQIACIGQFVDVDDLLVRLPQPIQYEVAADKAGTAGHDNCHSYIFLKRTATIRPRFPSVVWR